MKTTEQTFLKVHSRNAKTILKKYKLSSMAETEMNLVFTQTNKEE